MDMTYNKFHKKIHLDSQFLKITQFIQFRFL